MSHSADKVCARDGQKDGQSETNTQPPKPLLCRGYIDMKFD